MLVLFTILLLLKKKSNFLERSKFKEHMQWESSESSDDDICGLVHHELQ